MLRQVFTCSAAVALVAVVVGSQPIAAQDAEMGMFGSGPDRVCSVLLTKRGDAVLEKNTEQTGGLHQAHL